MAANAHAATRQRREPEGTVLYRVVQSEWATSLARFDAGERNVPRFCVREVEAFLRCGILAHGLAVVVRSVPLQRGANAVVRWAKREGFSMPTRRSFVDGAHALTWQPLRFPHPRDGRPIEVFAHHEPDFARRFRPVRTA